MVIFSDAEVLDDFVGGVENEIYDSINKVFKIGKNEPSQKMFLP